MGLHVDAVAVRAREDAHRRVGEAQGPEHVAHVGDVRRATVRHLHLPGVPPSKSMPKLRPRANRATRLNTIKVPDRMSPPPAVLDELEVRALVVEVGRAMVTAVTPGMSGGRRRRGARRRRGGHAVAPTTSSAAAMPTPGSWTSFGRRASTDTIGCMKKYASSRSIAVDRPRKNAKPRTELVAKAYSTAAPSSETRSAATIVRNDHAKPGSSEERTVLPVRTSSLSRSKYTT